MALTQPDGLRTADVKRRSLAEPTEEFEIEGIEIESQESAYSGLIVLVGVFATIKYSPLGVVLCQNSAGSSYLPSRGKKNSPKVGMALFVG